LHAPWSVGVVVVSCSGRPGRRDKEEEGPIGFLAGGGAKFEVTPLTPRFCLKVVSLVSCAQVILRNMGWQNFHFGGIVHNCLSLWLWHHTGSSYCRQFSPVIVFSLFLALCYRPTNSYYGDVCFVVVRYFYRVMLLRARYTVTVTAVAARCDNANEILARTWNISRNHRQLIYYSSILIAQKAVVSAEYKNWSTTQQ